MAAEPSATDIMYERIKDPAWLSGKGGPGEWSSGLCDCFSDCRLCIISIVPVLDTFNIAQTVSVRVSCVCSCTPVPPSAARFCVSALPDARLATRQYNVSAAKEGLADEPICGLVLPILSVCTGTCAILSCIQVEQRACLRGGGASCGLCSRVSHSVARHARAAMTRTSCE